MMDDEVRATVRQELPELEEIRDEVLRDQVIEAWTLALTETEFRRISDIPPQGEPGRLTLRQGTQADHMRGTATMAVAMLEGLERVVGPLAINRDFLIAAALLHDVGKPFEFSERNRSRWRDTPGETGLPAVRHPAYGAHIAMMAGLPEPIVHVVAAHSQSREGQFVQASALCTIVHYADAAFWQVLRRLGVVEE